MDDISLKSDNMDTEQELHRLQNQASIDDKDSDDEILTGDGSDIGSGMSKKEQMILKSRLVFRLVEINFPATIIKA